MINEEKKYTLADLRDAFNAGQRQEAAFHKNQHIIGYDKDADIDWHDYIENLKAEEPEPEPREKLVICDNAQYCKKTGQCRHRKPHIETSSGCEPMICSQSTSPVRCIPYKGDG